MIDSTVLGAVVDECSAFASELVVECHAGGEAAEPGDHAFAEAGERSGAVAFEGEQVFAGPEDRFDPLTDRGEVRSLSFLVFAAGANEGGVEQLDLGGELASRVPLVAEQRFTAGASAAIQEHQADLAFVDLWGTELQRAGRAVGAEDRVQPEPPEIPGVAGAPAVISGVRQRRTLHSLTGARALNGRRIDQQQTVGKAWALAGEHAHQPLQALGQPAATFEVSRLTWQLGKQVTQPLASDRQEPPVRRDTHDRLRDTKGDDLRVGHSSLRVLGALGQEIVGRHINGREQQVEVGVHRDSSGSAMRLSTADFDPAAHFSSKTPTTTTNAVESII